MSAFFDSILKGIQPLIDKNELEKDDGYALLSAQNEIKDKKSKAGDVLQAVGQLVYQRYKAVGSEQDSELLRYFQEFELLSSEIGRLEEKCVSLKVSIDQKEKQRQAEAESRICPCCGFENEAGIKFCQECGTKLVLCIEQICSSCGANNAPDVKFCGVCGNKLSQKPAE